MKKILLTQGELKKGTTIQLPDNTRSLTGDFIPRGICYVRGSIVYSSGSKGGFSFSRTGSVVTGAKPIAKAIEITETKGLVTLYAITE